MSHLNAHPGGADDIDVSADGESFASSAQCEKCIQFILVICRHMIVRVSDERDESQSILRALAALASGVQMEEAADDNALPEVGSLSHSCHRLMHLLGDIGGLMDDLEQAVDVLQVMEMMLAPTNQRQLQMRGVGRRTTGR